MTKKLLVSLLALTMVATLALSACGKGAPAAYKDGTYTGVYVDQEAKDKSSSEVTLKIESGRIVDCQYVEKDKNGKVKDKDYGKDSGEANYQLAQIAVEGMQSYPGQLLEKQNPDEMDAVSGATVSFKCFQEAARQALDKASK